MVVNLDMYMAMMAGIAALLLGLMLNRKVPFLKRICIPAPVTGGLLVSIVTLLLHNIFGLEIKFDDTLKDICMMMFFTTVGYQSNFTVFKTGGRHLAIMVGLIAILVITQNFISVGLAPLVGIDPLTGMAAGSITMLGGHGTAAGFTSLMEGRGLDGAGSIMMATATFGLLAGSLLGGPLGEHLINRYHLSPESPDEEKSLMTELGKQQNRQTFADYAKASYEIFIAIGLGTLLSKALANTGISFPTYFGPLIVAALIRNFTELLPGCPKIEMSEIESIGNICLSLFLGMAMVSLRLWQLSGIALPLLAILVIQVLAIALFGRFVAFPLLGQNYDAAMLVSGLCGFGLGATPNAMANMGAISAKYHYSKIPFIVVPIVGAMFVDIINITVITLFMNFI